MPGEGRCPTRKLGLACAVALMLVPWTPAGTAATEEAGPLADATHWTSTGTPELLREVARRIESLDPQDSRTLARAGEVMLRAGAADQAADLFRRAQKADPKDDEAFVLIAMAYSGRKMWAEADRWFALAVGRDPKDLDHVIEWGVSYWNRGEKENAARQFTKALQSEPKNTRFYHKIGRGLEQNVSWANTP